jgi:hypothetical protein
MTIQKISLEQQELDRRDEVDLRSKQLVVEARVAGAGLSRAVVCSVEADEAVPLGDQGLEDCGCTSNGSTVDGGSAVQ